MPCSDRANGALAYSSFASSDICQDALYSFNSHSHFHLPPLITCLSGRLISMCVAIAVVFYILRGLCQTVGHCYRYNFRNHRDEFNLLCNDQPNII